MLTILQDRVVSTSVETQPKIVAVQVEAPRTLGELRALEFKREQLSGQLANLTERRGRLLGEALLSKGSDREAVDGRIRETDRLVARLERELDQTNAAIANTRPGLLTQAGSQVDPARIAERIAEEVVPLVGIVSLFVLAPIAFAIARLIWRRATAATRPAPVDTVVHQRLEQLQQSMDTIAVEVERISESQRYLSKMMSEKQLGAGAAEPLPFAEKAAVASGRE